mgnify:CR=1 FL=1
MTTAAGISVTTVSTDQLAPLGFQLTVPNSDNGHQLWTYVFNDEASAAFAAGDIVQRDPSATTELMYGCVQAPASTAAAGASARCR